MDQMLDTLPAEPVLSYYAPEQRLAGLSPKQRLAGLDRDHQVLAWGHNYSESDRTGSS
jgi:hypothetical protein